MKACFPHHGKRIERMCQRKAGGGGAPPPGPPPEGAEGGDGPPPPPPAAGGPPPKGHKGPGGRDAHHEKMIKCAEGVDPAAAEKMRAFTKAPREQREARFQQMIKCKEDALAG